MSDITWGGAGFGMDIAPPIDFTFIEILLTLLSAFLPFASPSTDPTTMRSLLLVPIALPLASFALAINRVNSNAKSLVYTNGTTSNGYWLQRKHQGDTFFE